MKDIMWNLGALSLLMLIFILAYLTGDEKDDSVKVNFNFNFNFDHEKDFYCRRDEAYCRLKRSKGYNISWRDSHRFHNRWRRKWKEEGGIGPYHY